VLLADHYRRCEKTIEKSDGSMALKYKESVTGDAHLARDSGHADLAPGDGHTHAQLLIKRGDTWEPKTEIIGPGY